MRSYLIVANQTLASPTLAAAVAQRAAAGESTFHVVVPRTPIQHGLTWDEDEAERAAQERLDQVLARLNAMGVAATGEVGSKEPVDAVHDALRSHEADEIILSTLPGPGVALARAGRADEAAAQRDDPGRGRDRPRRDGGGVGRAGSRRG